MLNTAALNRDKVMGRQRTSVAKNSTPRVQARTKIPPHSRPFPRAKPSPLADVTQSTTLSQNSEPSQTATPIMPKLTIGAAGDKYEKEADAVASQVVQQLNSPASVQRVPGGGEEEAQTVQMKTIVQLKGASAGGAASPELEQSIQRERGKGQTLSESLRNPLENAFGADFSGVRIHRDNTADQLNQSIQAKAFTTGQDVFFRQGAYAPESKGGQELLAHELTHVVQQQEPHSLNRDSTHVQCVTENNGDNWKLVRSERLAPILANTINSMITTIKQDALGEMLKTPLIFKIIEAFAKSEYSSENVEAIKILEGWLQKEEILIEDAQKFDHIYGLRGYKELNAVKEELKAFSRAYRRTLTVDKTKFVASSNTRSLWKQLNSQVKSLYAGLKTNLGDTLSRCRTEKNLLSLLNQNQELKDFVAKEYQDQLIRKNVMAKRIKSNKNDRKNQKNRGVLGDAPKIN